MKKFNIDYLVAIPVILLLVISMSYFNAGLFHMDSIKLAKIVEEYPQSQTIEGLPGGRYLYVIINLVGYNFAQALFSLENSELTLKIINSIFGALSIIFLYFFTKEFLNNSSIALFSALYLAINPLFLSMSTYPKDHLFGLAFHLFAGFLYLNGLKKNNNLQKIIASFIVGISMFIRFTNLLFIIPLALLIYYKGKPTNLKKEITIFSVPIVIVIISFLIIQFSPLIYMLQNNIFEPFIRLNFENLKALFLTLTPVGILILLLGLWYCLKAYRFASLILLFWIMLEILFYMSFRTYVPRFAVMALIPISILLAISTHSLKKPKYLKYFILIIILIQMFITIHPLLKFRHQFSSDIIMDKALEQNTAPDSLIIIYPNRHISFTYYIDRAAISCDPFSINNTAPIDSLIDQIDIALNEDRDVYILDWCLGLADGHLRLYDVLSEKYSFEVAGKHNYEWDTGTTSLASNFIEVRWMKISEKQT